MVVDRDGERLLCAVLANHVRIEEVSNLAGLRELVERSVRRLGRELLFDHLVAELDAFVADVHAGAGDETANLLLRLPAEIALEQVTRFRGRAWHAVLLSGLD